MPRAKIETPERDWIGLSEAALELGISASTLRRWADEGAVRTFVTPGGHRRFWRPAIDSLIPGNRPTPRSSEHLGESERARMSRIYRQEVARDAQAEVPWAADLNTDERKLFRNHGRRIVADMLSALDAPDEGAREERLREASLSAEAYGRAAASIGLPASNTVETFVRFGRPFMNELSALARRRGLDAAATTDLLDRANAWFDRLLVALLRAYETAPVANPRPTSPAGLAGAAGDGDSIVGVGSPSR